MTHEEQLPRLHQAPASGGEPWSPPVELCADALAVPAGTAVGPARNAFEAPVAAPVEDDEMAQTVELPPPRAGRDLPMTYRVLFWVLGVLLLVLGIAGLFLPILQGVLFLVLGAAVLSVASRGLYFWLRHHLGERYPKLWIRLERFRTGLRWKLRHRH